MLNEARPVAVSVENCPADEHSMTVIPQKLSGLIPGYRYSYLVQPKFLI